MLINQLIHYRSCALATKQSIMAIAVRSARVELVVLVACLFVDVVAFRKAGLAKKEENQCKRASTTFSAVNRV